eukprot:15452124-Alexandrium_andersonii.AAC.1
MRPDGGWARRTKKGKRERASPLVHEERHIELQDEVGRKLGAPGRTGRCRCTTCLLYTSDAADDM